MDSPHPLSSVRSTGRRDRLTQSIINTRVAELKSPRHSRDSRLLPKGGGFMLGQAEERHFGLSDRSAQSSVCRLKQDRKAVLPIEQGLTFWLPLSVPTSSGRRLAAGGTL